MGWSGRRCCLVEISYSSYVQISLSGELLLLLVLLMGWSGRRCCLVGLWWGLWLVTLLWSLYCYLILLGYLSAVADPSTTQFLRWWLMENSREIYSWGLPVQVGWFLMTGLYWISFPQFVLWVDWSVLSCWSLLQLLVRGCASRWRCSRFSLSLLDAAVLY